jgi:hypothetical protein
MKEKNNKVRNLKIRVSEAEYQHIQKQFLKTADRKLSGYTRKMLLGKPVTIIYQNQSLEDIVTVLTKLENDLNGVANNYNQAIKKLNAYQQYHELTGWISAHEKLQQELLDKIGEIHLFIAKTAREWLQS